MNARLHVRRPIDLDCTKYLGSRPYFGRTMDLTTEGMRVGSLGEPEDTEDSFVVGLSLPHDDETMWIWARRVWKRDGEQAVRFVSMRPRDRARLTRFLTPSRNRPVPVFPEELLDA